MCCGCRCAAVAAALLSFFLRRSSAKKKKKEAPPPFCGCCCCGGWRWWWCVAAVVALLVRRRFFLFFCGLPPQKKKRKKPPRPAAGVCHLARSVCVFCFLFVCFLLAFRFPSLPPRAWPPCCPAGAKNKKPFYFWRLAFCFCPASLVGGKAFRVPIVTHTRVYISYNVLLGVLSAPLGRARKKNAEAPSRKRTYAALAAQQPPQQFGEAWRL